MLLVPSITSPWKVSLAFPNEVMEFHKRKVAINQLNVIWGQFGLKVGSSLQISPDMPMQRCQHFAPNQVFSNYSA